MSSQCDSTDGSSALERFLSSGCIDPDKLGEPSLGNGEDSLLDRERIHVESDTDESDCVHGADPVPDHLDAVIFPTDNGKATVLLGKEALHARLIDLGSARH
jgi:hypothetical protein